MIRRTLDGPVVAVGSGGSYTAASYLQALHLAATGFPSLALTPLQAESLKRLQPSSSAWLISARGRNNDILAAMRALDLLEPLSLNVLCASESSPLADAAQAAPFGWAHSFSSPAGRDGYLATNSLLATCVLLFRGYASLVGAHQLPSSLDDLMGLRNLPELIAQMDVEMADVWAKRYVLVLHDSDAELGARDLESKITEAALGFLQFADFRNFAHGRHHWLTRNGDDTAVVVLATEPSSRLARRTLQLFPRNIPVWEIPLKHQGPLAQIESLVWAYYLTASIGRSRLVDPGRPGIAEFGSRIYSLRTRIKPRNITTTAAAIERKIAASGIYDIQSWERRLEESLSMMRSERFGAIVFDLDGTLVDVKRRFHSTPNQALSKELTRLLDLGVRLAVATGRRRNATTRDLLRSTFPEKYWPVVLVGYNNASDITLLQNDDDEASSDPSPFVDVASQLKAVFGELGIELQATASPTQLSVRLKDTTKDTSARAILAITQHLAATEYWKLRVLSSSHSVDVIEPGAGKARILEQFTRKAGPGILSIGDSAAWPGNDIDLLAHRFGLSVDRTSPDPRSGWNLLPPGIRGVGGTVHYLQQLRPAEQASVCFDAKFPEV